MTHNKIVYLLPDKELNLRLGSQGVLGKLTAAICSRAIAFKEPMNQLVRIGK